MSCDFPPSVSTGYAYGSYTTHTLQGVFQDDAGGGGEGKCPFHYEFYTLDMHWVCVHEPLASLFLEAIFCLTAAASSKEDLDVISYTSTNPSARSKWCSC